MKLNLTEAYIDYKLENAKEYIANAKNKKELFDAVCELSITDLVDDVQLVACFNKKAEELGVDADKLMSWIKM